MLKSLKKHSYRFVVVLLLLTTLLTFDVGRVTKVEAVATTAAIAGAALIGTGAIYLSYLAFTGADISLPNTNIDDFLSDIGSKCVKYGTMAGLYGELSSFLREHGVDSLNDYIVNYDITSLKQFYNYFKDKAIIEEIMSFSEELEIVYPGLPISYFTNVTQVAEPLNTIYNSIGYPNGQIYTMGYLESIYTVVEGNGPRVTRYYYDNSTGSYVFYTVRSQITDLTFRNYMYDRVTSSGRHYISYKPQYFQNGEWVDFHDSIQAYYSVFDDVGLYGYISSYAYNQLRLSTAPQQQTLDTASNVPLFPDLEIFDSINNQIIEAHETSPDRYVTSPNWPMDSQDPDDNTYPIVPFIQLPSGGGGGIWGTDLGSILDKLEELAGNLIDASVIGGLINAFKNSLSGTSIDNSYSYYSDDDNNYYSYYSNTYNDNDYNTYNINVSEQEDIIPVDLNTIQQYTNNQYLNLIKERAETFGKTFGELVAFWHNCDPEIVYAFLGASIIVLLGAFIGKWGHS